MPEIRHYTVTQEREIKVWANSPAEAAQIADAAFNDKLEGDGLTSTHIRSPIRERTLDVREDN